MFFLDKLMSKYGSQEKAAKAIGISQAALSKWQTGKGFPNRKNAKKIANNLGIRIGDVYEGISNDQPH